MEAEQREATWLDVAREYFPGASDTDLHALLWEATCFPFGAEAQVRENLEEARSLGSIEAAIAASYESMGVRAAAEQEG